MPYTLENPIDSLKVVAESEAGWLGRFEDNGSEIMFFVDPNEEASSRSAEVTAVYGDIVQTFTVNQEGAVGPFQFNVKEIGYDHITYDVIPEDKEMTYISYVIHSDYAGWDPDDTDAYIQDELNWYSFIAGDLSAYLEGIALKGDATDLVADGLDASREYVLWAFGCTLQGEPTTELVYQYFTTEPITSSDNQLTLEVFDVEDTQASISIYTTNKDPYVYGAALAEPYKNLTDEEILAKLLEMDLSGNVRTGDFVNQTFWNLVDETEYVVFVFGYEAGAATIALVKEFFTTESLEVADIDPIEIITGPFYDVDDVLAEYPELSEDFYYGYGRALGMINFGDLPEGSVGFMWAMQYKNVMDEETYRDSQLLSLIGTFGLGEVYLYNWFNYGEDHTIFAAAFTFDEKGNQIYGPVSRVLVNVTKDDVSPVSEFPINLYRAPAYAASSEPLMVSLGRPAEEEPETLMTARQVK